MQNHRCREVTNESVNINHSFGINQNVTIAYEVQGAQPNEMVTKLGGGTAIKILDGSVISDYRMVRYLKDLADQEKISWQNEILPAGGTDAAAIQKYGKDGAITGGLSITLSNMNQGIETAHKEDVNATVELLVAAVKNLDQYNWEFR